MLELTDDELVDAIGGRERALIDSERAAFEPAAARAAAARNGLELLCRCDPAYPARLHDLPAPPAVLHIAGSLERFLSACDGSPVGLVGTREPTVYGVELATVLGRQLAAAGVTVVSGMARGVDAAAHAGALAPGTADPYPGTTLAVLPGCANLPYPRTLRALHRRLMREASVVSELGPGTAVRRWSFPARNRIIAALCDVTVVIEAAEGSGALLTATVAHELGRTVGAVPGRVTTPQAAGPHALIAGGARLVRGAQDVIELLFEAGWCPPEVADSRPPDSRPPDSRPPLSDGQAALLRELESRSNTATALARCGLDVDRGLAELAALELAGRVRRLAGGRYMVLP